MRKTKFHKALEELRDDWITLSAYFLNLTADLKLETTMSYMFLLKDYWLNSDYTDIRHPMDLVDGLASDVYNDWYDDLKADALRFIEIGLNNNVRLMYKDFIKPEDVLISGCKAYLHIIGRKILDLIILDDWKGVVNEQD